MAQRPKKDFEGKTKTRDTYDKDWVFHNGAWVTKRQRKKAIADQKEAKAYRESLQAAQNPAPAPSTPGVPAPPVTVPILGPTPAPTPAPSPTAPTGPDETTIVYGPPGPPGSVITQPGHVRTPSVPPELAQKGRGTRPEPGFDPNNPAAPPWWINAAIQNPTTEEQKFANAANAILPTLSPEDQRTLASYLAQNFKDTFGGYAQAQFGEPPTEITGAVRNRFLSPQRAQTALVLLERMRQASGAQEMGAGYDFLRNAVNLMNQFSTGGVMTREKYQQFAAAVANLQKNATGDISAYGNLAQLFNLPSFSAGPLVSNTPNNKLFG